MQKKDDKVGNQTANKEGEKKKRAKIFGFCAWVKTKKLFNYVRLVGKCAFFLAKLVFSHSYAN